MTLTDDAVAHCLNNYIHIVTITTFLVELPAPPLKNRPARQSARGEGPRALSTERKVTSKVDQCPAYLFRIYVVSTNETPDLLKSEPMSTEDGAGLLVEFLNFSFFKHYVSKINNSTMIFSERLQR